MPKSKSKSSSNPTASQRLSAGKGQPSYRTMAPTKWSQSKISILTPNKRLRKKR